MTNKETTTYAEKKERLFKESLKKAIIQFKPKTVQELEELVQLIWHKVEAKK